MTWTWLGIAAAIFFICSCFAGFRRGFVREAVSMLFVVLSVVIVWFINPYVNDFIRENTPVYETIQGGCRSFVEEQVPQGTMLDREKQTNIIDDLHLPALLTDGIKENNTAEVYRYLSVTSFVDYVSGYLAQVAVNGISFLVSFVLATLLIRMVSYALNIIASLPVIRGVNKAAGALLGGAKCVVFIWIAFLVLTVLCNTSFGEKGLELVQQDTILSFLYNQNVLAWIFTGIFYGA